MVVAITEILPLMELFNTFQLHIHVASKILDIWDL